MKLLIRSTLVLSSGLLLATPAIGDPLPAWVNSYSVDEACYCAPSVDSSLRKIMMPTPVGGKSVGQICERIGDGPGLTLIDGDFNHPVYTDAQCGHGPMASSEAAAEECEGRLAEDDILCMGTGPSWDLKAAFARKATPSEPKKPAIAPAPVTTKIETAKVEPSAAEPIPAVEPKPELASQDESSVDSDSTAVKQLPLATIVDTKTTDTTTADVTEVEKLPAAQIVSSRVVSESETGVSEVKKQQAAIEPEKSAAPPEPAATKTTIVRAPDTDSGAVLVEQKIEDEVTASGDSDVAVVVKTPVKEPSIAPVQRADETAATDVVANSSGADTKTTPVNTGLRIDAGIVRTGVRSNYVQLAPIGFDFGGNGASVEAGFGRPLGWGVIGRGSVVQDYSEFMLGVAHTSRLQQLKGATTMFKFGAETGEFDLGITELSDSGVFVSGSVGYDFNRRWQGQTGISYSTFFDGDPNVFGLLLLHATPALDIASRVELGDNDNFSLGLRFHY